MTGFEPGSSGIVSDCSANCATTTSHLAKFFRKQFELGEHQDVKKREKIILNEAPL